MKKTHGKGVNMRLPVNCEIEKRLQKYERSRILFEDDEQTLLDDAKHTYCFKLPHEKEVEYKYRKSIFVNGFVNPTLELINAPGNVIFRTAPKEEIAEDTLTHEFAENVTRSKVNKISLTRWMQDIAAPMLRLNGTCFIVMDMPQEAPLSKQDQIDRMITPYINYINPKNVINWEIENGEFVWFAYWGISKEPWNDFASKPPKPQKAIYVWDKNNLSIFIGNSAPIVKPHNFGFAPVIYQAAYCGNSNDIVGDASFFTTSKLIFSAMNFLTCANMEILKYSSSLLLMPTEAICGENSTTDDSGNVVLKKQYDSTTFVYGGQTPPAFLTKDLQSIPIATEQYKLYMSEAIDNEKSAKSLGKLGVSGNDIAQSGIAKAIDRDPIEANIVATATDCESLHRKILSMACRILEEREDSIKVEYEKTYDIKSFDAKLENLKKFVNDIKGYPSITGKREMYKSITEGITEDPDKANTINTEIDNADVSESIVDNAALEALINPKKGEFTDDENGGGRTQPTMVE